MPSHMSIHLDNSNMLSNEEMAEQLEEFAWMLRNSKASVLSVNVDLGREDIDASFGYETSYLRGMEPSIDYAFTVRVYPPYFIQR